MKENYMSFDEALHTIFEDETEDKVDYKNIYVKDVSEHNTIDCYDICELYNITNPALAHAIKKMLCAGQRGNKSVQQDLREAISSIERAIEIFNFY